MSSVLSRLFACAFGLAVAGTPLLAHADGQDFVTIERGRYLATAGDCISCHTAPGGKPFAGGRGIMTPFGVIYTPNITPDRDTGLGAWSNDQFVAAMQHGVGQNGELLYPALPYPYYTKVRRDDLVAIKAYLDTLDPVRNEAPPNGLPFPLNVRTALLGWNMLFFTPGEFKPDAAKSEEWNRGAYLVEGLGHCGACHTPKNQLGGDKTDKVLAGGVLDEWYAPNLGSDLRTGLGAWSVEDIVQYLKTGRNAKSAASGPMAEVVYYSTQHMTDADLKAMATYLKDRPSAPAAPAPKPLPAEDPVMKAGLAVYQDNCSACHVSTGAGIARLFPALKDSAVVQADEVQTLVRIIDQGTRATATKTAPTGPGMPAFNWKLNDVQTAAVITYIRNAWGNAAAPVSAEDVKRIRGRLTDTAATP
ncbi:putative cytochrome-c oxidase protein [Azorhizobium caulinodans ORS 571]|uniref:Putative cytochrome-c oxidase protein n=1 Tax=Azorhizobium caulinodans (strain ATCC 43989 / DSM 5975 / JCM 20966 / LMG 6465 / NBRC 14845 / NCIMB 13405 / ORS 571) TaxID=438753 RepID=A8I8Y4_AZOC5|nr:cytochrome c [Azorhizobium caulinodans]BAF88718.1 putative cytochrome-c oxidase protein [Azorhizobium caulinodans ORS 571]